MSITQNARRRQSHVTGKAATIGRCNQASDSISQRLLDWLEGGRRPQVRSSVSPAPPTLHWRYELWYRSTRRDIVPAAHDVVSRRRIFYKHDRIVLAAPYSCSRDNAGSLKTIANLVCMHASFVSDADWQLQQPDTFRQFQINLRTYTTYTSLFIIIIFAAGGFWKL